MNEAKKVSAIKILIQYIISGAAVDRELMDRAGSVIEEQYQSAWADGVMTPIDFEGTLALNAVNVESIPSDAGELSSIMSVSLDLVVRDVEVTRALAEHIGASMESVLQIVKGEGLMFDDDFEGSSDLMSLDVLSS